ncbi:hypothetical protein OB925_08115 [Aeromonas rivipollensis]|uniref:hypothetical protein n=1 Tax=Aeromonas rivipollensis TaxID=948519 RepID=UPI000D136722|nr:hypothetical protein [Aeromonas rivipollensis]AVP94973.1 hypothetical protein C7N77_18520 [Aeromonas rivipollensis]MDM5085129.1 hypothetical protein [Aeromonas rivipollensis]MDM5097200.1 hypothetical protein [Aeromonas rivipollensis]MDM5105539.1 hypothetical protein [Aeromonas rivipollensis]
MWKGTLALLTCMQLTACATPFERMWQGLATCDLDELYLDSESGEPSHPLLKTFTPDKTSDGFAWYKTHQELHGLPITGFLIPASTFEVHALFVDTPIANARRLTHNAYGSEFADEQKHDRGEAPLLLRDPGNPKRSIIDCTKGESADPLPEEPFPE